MTSPQLQARIAGFLYVIVIGASVFALVTTSGMIVSGDAAATAANIQASEQMFRFSFVANLIACAAYVAVVAILYEVLKPAGKTLSIVAAFFGLAGCAVSGAVMLNQLTALAYLDDAAYLSAFTSEQLQALSRVSLRAGGLGNTLSLVFFGIYCLVLANLVFKAKFLPRFLGVLPMMAGLGWLTGSFATLLALDLPLFSYVIPVSGLGEGLFTLWLLVMGVDAAKWREQAGA